MKGVTRPELEGGCAHAQPGSSELREKDWLWGLGLGVCSLKPRTVGCLLSFTARRAAACLGRTAVEAHALPRRRTANSELVRTRGIRLFN